MAASGWFAVRNSELEGTFTIILELVSADIRPPFSLFWLFWGVLIEAASRRPAAK